VSRGYHLCVRRYGGADGLRRWLGVGGGKFRLRGVREWDVLAGFWFWNVYDVSSGLQMSDFGHCDASGVSSRIVLVGGIELVYIVQCRFLSAEPSAGLVLGVPRGQVLSHSWAHGIRRLRGGYV